jgi:hypothetical protein
MQTFALYCGFAGLLLSVVAVTAALVARTQNRRDRRQP